jgi:phosphopantothenoylcysteine decarboxylase/phosphopantothenate--cysteine ligase
LRGKKILITAGPTYEKLDPVRFIGNYSSGKMGYALAEECAERGAQVVLVSGPTALTTKSALILRISVESAQEMYESCLKEFPDCRAAILCAAVADFTPQNTAGEKIKREGNTLHLDLRPTPDIAAALGQQKKEGQVMAGFALETCNEASHAREKLERKRLDFIVLNSLRDEGAGFRTDTNKVTLIDRNKEEALPLMSKKEVATHIVDKLAELL